MSLSLESIKLPPVSAFRLKEIVESRKERGPDFGTVLLTIGGETKACYTEDEKLEVWDGHELVAELRRLEEAGYMEYPPSSDLNAAYNKDLCKLLKEGQSVERWRKGGGLSGKSGKGNAHSGKAESLSPKMGSKSVISPRPTSPRRNEGIPKVVRTGGALRTFFFKGSRYYEVTPTGNKTILKADLVKLIGADNVAKLGGRREEKIIFDVGSGGATRVEKKEEPKEVSKTEVKGKVPVSPKKTAPKKTAPKKVEKKKVEIKFPSFPHYEPVTIKRPFYLGKIIPSFYQILGEEETSGASSERSEEETEKETVPLVCMDEKWGYIFIDEKLDKQVQLPEGIEDRIRNCKAKKYFGLVIIDDDSGREAVFYILDPAKKSYVAFSSSEYEPGFPAKKQMELAFKNLKGYTNVTSEELREYSASLAGEGTEGEKGEENNLSRYAGLALLSHMILINPDATPEEVIQGMRERGWEPEQESLKTTLLDYQTYLSVSEAEEIDKWSYL